MTDPILVEIIVLGLALALDLALGEPPNRLHPTVWIGKTISWAERAAPKSPGAQLVYGGAIALLIPAGWGAASWIVAQGLLLVHPLAYIAGGALALKTTFSVRMLHRAASDVRSSLRGDDIAAVRSGMPALVSRDPSSLTAAEATAAAVESVSENLTDSIIGPLLAFALFGLPGAVAYRAINTLDSMIGYHGRYEYLGKAAARLDDLVNVIPARFTALLLVGGSWAIPGQAASGAWRIMWRDRGRTESPNAGWTMSAMAGALGVALEKTGHYRLGDATRAIEPEDISRAVQSMYWVTGMAVVISAGLIFLAGAAGLPRPG